ncbi:hypothetical protein D3C83_30360 [compost metagenome]
MVGSRCSMAVTAAVTNPSKSRSIDSYRRLFSTATAAWLDSARMMSAVSSRNEMTFSGTFAAVNRAGAPTRLRLMSCSTPMTSPAWFVIGNTSSERVR